MVQISQELFDEILGALKDERAHWQQRWKNVGNHPASRHRREFRYFDELIRKIENEISSPQTQETIARESDA